MTPYYDQDGIRIFHADCRDVLDEWEGLRMKSFDLLLTDPPYGVGTWSATGGNSLSEAETAAINGWDQRIDSVTLHTAIRLARYAIVWGGNYYGDLLGATRAPLVWDKAQRGMHFADGELAWTNFDFGTLRICDLPIARGGTKGHRLHPTEKPEDLMAWCIRQVKGVASVLDPFLGSGTTLVAAKRLGKTGVGIEREEKYCEVAAKRLSQGVLTELFG